MKTEHPRRKLTIEQIDRAERAIKTYQELISYWSKSYRVRQITIRMNQSEEAIAEYLSHCKQTLLYWELTLNNLQESLSFM